MTYDLLLAPIDNLFLVGIVVYFLRRYGNGHFWTQIEDLKFKLNFI